MRARKSWSAPARETVHIAAILRHPLWLLSLSLLVANDQWAKAAGVLPPLVTGKLSDVVGPIVAGGALAVALRVRSRRAAAACFALAAAGVAAINLSPSLAGAVEALSAGAAALGIGWAWHITVDPTDVLALLPLPWAVQILLRATAVPAAATSGPDLRPDRDLVPGVATLPRWLQGALLGAAGLASAATSQEPPTIRPDTFTFAWDAQLVLGNATSQPLHVRLRWLRPDVKVDCTAIRETPSETLHRGLFTAGRTFELLAGRTMPLGGTRNPQNLGLDAEAFAERACYALLIDGGTLPERLVVYTSVDFPMTGIDQRTDVAKAERLVAFEAASKSSATLRWRSHTALFSPPAPQASTPAPGCALVNDAATASNSLEAHLASSDASRFGLLPDLAVKSIESDVAGCHRVQILSKLSSSNSTLFEFTVCLPKGAMPFAAGDEVQFKRNPLAQDNGVLEGYEITSKTHRLRVGRGGQPVLYGNEPWTTLPAANCADSVGSCGAVGQAIKLEITLPLPGAKPWSLAVGESIPLDSKRRLWLTQAATFVAAVPKCKDGASALGTFLETVLVEEITP